MANLVTLLRLPLLALVVGLLYGPDAGNRYLAAGLIVLLILLDTLDGVIARATHHESLMGSVLDIAADRAVELVLWVTFANLKLIPVVVPLIVITRGVFVDAIRSVAPARGLTPFALMRTRLGRFLVKSPWLRTPYGIAKVFAFFLLAVEYGIEASVALSGVPPAGLAASVDAVAQVATWIAVTLCLVRGIPVLVEGPRALREPSDVQRPVA